MAVKASKRLVIDSSVARSSGGEDATFPTSKNCRDFLKAVLNICYRVVMSREMTEEWNKHQSNFARSWRVSMEARRKVYRPDPVDNTDLHTKIEGGVAAEKKREAVLKDFHLLEAALATDQIIVSLDETARNLCCDVATKVGEIRRLVWVNPDVSDEECIKWLEEGAKAEKERWLGFKEQKNE